MRWGLGAGDGATASAWDWPSGTTVDVAGTGNTVHNPAILASGDTFESQSEESVRQKYRHIYRDRFALTFSVDSGAIYGFQ